jgi:hypothetical protein
MSLQIIVNLVYTTNVSMMRGIHLCRLQFGIYEIQQKMQLARKKLFLLWHI